MKKLTALLMACTMTVSALASCGKDDSTSGSESKKKDVLSGTWNIEDEDEIGGSLILDDGNLDFNMDLSEMIHFKDKDCIADGSSLGEESVKVEDDVISVSYNGYDLLSMKRKESKGDNYDGVYTPEGGMLFESMLEELDAEKTEIVVDGENLLIQTNKIGTYEITGDDTVKVTDPTHTLTDEDQNEAEFKFSVDGDKLSLTPKAADSEADDSEEDSKDKTLNFTKAK